MNCLQLIRNRYASLTDAEQKIADQVLQNSPSIVQMSVSELAALAGVANSAVIRFSKSMGFEGYKQLKLAIAECLGKNKELNYTPYIYPNDSAAKIMEKVFSANVKALHDTAEALDPQMIDTVLEQITQAENIYLYGIGTSASMVTELQYRLMLLGFRAFAFTDPPTMKVSTMNITPRDLAIGISHSGRTIATLDALTLAEKAGANTMCITSFPESPITQLCQTSLCVYSDEMQYPVEAMSSKLAQLSLIYGLTTALSAKNYEETARRNKHSRDLINTIRTGEQL